MTSGGKAVLVTGSRGFIGSHVCAELLSRGYSVVGVDDYSKYGPVARPHDPHPSFRLVRADCSSDKFRARFMGGGEDAGTRFDYVIAGAAVVGGIAYFHRSAYGLLAANERMLASTFDIAVDRHKRGLLDRVVVVSSSMVYENAAVWPAPEGRERACPAPSSAYGFQKLASEHFARAARAQHGLPYTIVRPFNCVGVGEEPALGEGEAAPGSGANLPPSHVLPDLAGRRLFGQDPPHILGSGRQARHYANGRDVARGVRMAIESEHAVDDFNISTPQGTAVLGLARMLWKRTNPGRPFRAVSDPPYEHDVQRRVPDTEKARRVLGFEAEVGLAESLDEVVGWLRGRGAGGSGMPAPEGAGPTAKGPARGAAAAGAARAPEAAGHERDGRQRGGPAGAGGPAGRGPGPDGTRGSVGRRAPPRARGPLGAPLEAAPRERAARPGRPAAQSRTAPCEGRQERRRHRRRRADARRAAEAGTAPRAPSWSGLECTGGC